MELRNKQHYDTITDTMRRTRNGAFDVVRRAYKAAMLAGVDIMSDDFRTQLKAQVMKVVAAGIRDGEAEGKRWAKDVLNG